jgi:hypothetical protein
VLGEEGVVEPRHALGAGHVRVRDKPAQASPPDLRSREEDEVRSANALGDAAQVLLDGRSGDRAAGHARLAVGMAGRRSPRGWRPGRQRSDDGVVGADEGRRSRPHPGPLIEQLDLDTDDRMIPTDSAAVTNRTAPYSPAWSVTGERAETDLGGRSTRSSGADAPSRNEKLVWLWSSA